MRHDQERTVREICAQRGITITKVGAAWRLTGPGILLVTADLALVRAHELEPPKHLDHARACGDSRGARPKG